MSKSNSKLNTPKDIHIKGARTNNLNDVELRIPKNKLVVVTGVSGSGKSSLVMDTLYAEGQRRYVESMSSYARQFLGRMKKPDVDFINGISPAIAIEQRVSSGNARSTVGTMTEVYDYLRLLYARIGITISPISGERVTKHQVSDVVDKLVEDYGGRKAILMAPMKVHDRVRSVKKELELLLQKGFTRVFVKDEQHEIQDLLESNNAFLNETFDKVQSEYRILIDRFVVDNDPENIKRISDSVGTAFYEGGGYCHVDVLNESLLSFSNKFELDGLTFLEPSPQLFNYNNPYGACKKCEGYGLVLGIDPKKVIPDKTKSVYEGAIACWKGEKHGLWKSAFIAQSQLVNFPIHKPYQELSEDEKTLIWEGNKDVNGVNDFFDALQEQSYKIQNRVIIARYRGRTICPRCKGGRLREEAGYVHVSGRPISDLIQMSVGDLLTFLNNLQLTDYQSQVGKRILVEIKHRLNVMDDIGLSYLSINRQSSSLSGGETQRINLTRTLGSNLTSSLYILDEPSIGLHPRDTLKLVAVLKKLRDLGNTVIVVEHEEDIIRHSDHLIDVGPLAGRFGGNIVYQGPIQNGNTDQDQSLTLAYLQGKNEIALPGLRRNPSNKIVIKGAAQHNLKNIDVTIPLNAITVVTGVSGSGKTTLVRHILYPALLRELDISHPSKIGSFQSIDGDVKMLTGVEMISQQPIGRSSRSNPITYVKAYDEIRKLMVNQQLSKIRGYKPKHFSFNTEGGRCENCKGDGYTTIEMQFLADVILLCEDCKGQRFKSEVLEVKYKGKNIFEILNMSVEESIEFFEEEKSILKKIKPLDDVGLGYVKLGQASSTLSGGEAQRVKLASFLTKEGSSDHQFFIFDEPSTGLHFDDIKKLLAAFQALVEKGHTVLIVEHNIDIIKSADWVVDLGPEGGDAGGDLIFQGTPEELVEINDSHTGHFLSQKLQKSYIS